MPATMYAATRMREALPAFPNLPLKRSQKPLQRRRRHAFHPDKATGPYRLPRAVEDRLGAVLAAFQNAEAAYALAVFLARHWTAPNRLGSEFPIDRRALADHRELGLSESRIRGAIQTLESVGFLDRAIPMKGSAYQRKGDALHRKAVLFAFSAEYATAFEHANSRARKRQQTTAYSGASAPSGYRSPKNKISIGRGVFMGERVASFQNGLKPVARQPLPIPQSQPESAAASGLEAALERWRKAIEA